MHKETKRALKRAYRIVKQITDADYGDGLHGNLFQLSFDRGYGVGLMCEWIERSGSRYDRTYATRHEIKYMAKSYLRDAMDAMGVCK